MSRIIWDEVGERYYELGTKNGVLYPMSNGAYGTGVAWNGLTGVSEKPTGGDVQEMYADDILYAAPRAKDKFEATIEAYTYPDEFGECIGEKTAAPGVSVGQQKHKMFGMCYKTTIGEGEDPSKGYKLHLIYGATASAAQRDYKTMNENPEAITFSFDLKTVPTDVTGFEPTAYIEIDSRTADATKLAALENILYGTDAVTGDNPVAATNPTLPSPDTVISTMSTTTTTTP